MNKILRFAQDDTVILTVFWIKLVLPGGDRDPVLSLF